MADKCVVDAQQIDVTDSNGVVATTTQMTGTATIYVPLKMLKTITDCAVELVWTGTPTGTFTVEATIASGLYSSTNWTDLGVTVGNPAGSADSSIISFTNLQFPYVRVKYVNASGSGTLTAYQHAKGG